MRGSPSAFPLQVIRQYPLAQLENMFREVVHGTAWAQRKFRPFGVPAVERLVVAAPAALQTGGGAMHRWLPDTWSREDATAPSIPATEEAVSGEGLMLWNQSPIRCQRRRGGAGDQEAVWKPRGAASRTTQATLKYKPTVLGVARVSEEPRLPHRGTESEPPNAGDCDTGFRVGLQWWDPTGPGWTQLYAYIPPSLDARRALANFPMGSMVFFTFVMYNTHPFYLHALGPTLSQWMVNEVQRAKGHGLAALEDVPSLESLRYANRWPHGELGVVFPTQFTWDPLRFVSHSHGRARFGASPVLGPPAGWKPTSTDSVRQAQAAATAREQRSRDAALATLRTTLSSVPYRQWLSTGQPRSYLAHVLTFTSLYTALWLRTTKAATVQPQTGVSRHRRRWVPVGGGGSAHAVGSLRDGSARHHGHRTLQRAGPLCGLAAHHPARRIHHDGQCVDTGGWFPHGRCRRRGPRGRARAADQHRATDGWPGACACTRPPTALCGTSCTPAGLPWRITSAHRRGSPWYFVWTGRPPTSPCAWSPSIWWTPC